MLSATNILDEVRSRANERQHEIWLHVLELYRKDRFKNDRSHYPLKTYVELKLRRHHLNKLLHSDHHYAMEGYKGRTDEEITRTIQDEIALVQDQLDAIVQERNNYESRWESYLPASL